MLWLGLGLVWCYGQGKLIRVRVRIRVRVARVWVRVVNTFGVMVRVSTTQNLNPDP